MRSFDRSDVAKTGSGGGGYGVGDSSGAGSLGGIGTIGHGAGAVARAGAGAGKPKAAASASGTNNQVVGVDEADIVVHDAHRTDPSYAFALSRLSSQDLRYTPMGVFRSIEKPTYEAMMSDQLEDARSAGAADLDQLLQGNDNWVVD